MINKEEWLKRIKINELNKKSKSNLINLILNLKHHIFSIQKEKILKDYFVIKLSKKTGKNSYRITIPSHHAKHRKLKIDQSYRVYLIEDEVVPMD